ncbi:MAG: hypothetical protein A3C58_03130 [Candidatus Staskawiczbacteria bacterium RIFCSPHIGHO2_02_FULL_34_10]|uniref:Uncharacterized protein n=2 Tax=Candidatus Staskawicziibacteriota TaxID=1817916 RepID=A0A1G2HIY4_9BACT|nr:MAG: hypothetical protein A2639_01010 [Candidatus Staskawiczbacteria bacterium RIFCSPHIGHO2_01_FULL_34_27]OGZ67786.1 MAG: hypothetical protein A3C58_03130 [Candidatus Staskawiczbacteria bacterium RIFCSPHIGHO2_02_FULL_34_10]
METKDLLVEYAYIINQYGPDSLEAKNFIEENLHDDEFVELAELSRIVKKGFINERKKREER